jgi:hypothetical protein
MAHQLHAVPTHRLGEPYGELSDPDLRDSVRHAMRVYLDLD